MRGVRSSHSRREMSPHRVVAGRNKAVSIVPTKRAVA